jgi:DNA-binding response OmpR family regulator
MSILGRILLVEDDPKDVELTLTALEEYHLANEVVVKPVDFHEFVNAIRELGIFWAIINEPPPGSIKTN